MQIIYMIDYETSKFLPRSEFKWIDPKEFDSIKHTSKS